MNQARSPFAEAVIREHFPDFETFSAGVDATPGVPYLRKTVEVANTWGLAIESGLSRRLSNKEDLNEIEIIICAEQYMADFVLALGFRGKLLNFENLAPDSSFMPRDPETLIGRSFKTELAKVASLTLRGLRSQLDQVHSQNITALIPATDSSTDKALRLAVNMARSCDALLIDADLRVPLVQRFRSLSMRVGTLENYPEHNRFDVLSAMTEQRNPESRLIGRDWGSMIDQIAQVRRLILVTSPQEIETGPLPDSYLASYPAADLRIIH